MPNLGVKLHDGRSEGILGWDLNINDVCASFVGCSRRTSYARLEMSQVARVVIGRPGCDVRNGGIGLNVGQLLGYPTNPVASHGFSSRLRVEGSFPRWESIVSVSGFGEYRNCWVMRNLITEV